MILKELIDDILERDYTFSDCITAIKQKCDNPESLELFLKDYKDEVDSIFMDFLYELKDIHLIRITEAYEKSGKQIPTLKLCKNAFLAVQHFQREVEGVKYISNISGFKDIKHPFIELIYLDEAIRNCNGVDVSFCFFDFGDTKIYSKHSKLLLLWKIEDFISDELKEQPQIIAESNLPELPENNFDSTDIKEVYQYFKSHLVDKKRLTEDELIQYLKVAFEDVKEPKNSFRLDYSIKKDIQEVFYSYYKDIAGKPHGRQQQYVNLLKKYFVGFEKLSTTNFSKIY